MKLILILVFLVEVQCVYAQTCTGGLGDPMVNITFGQGAGPGPALGPGITNLQYLSGGCPDDGQYAIVSATSGCWDGTWQPVDRDHTGNPNGYFMLINASIDPSDFYVQDVNGLCGGTTFQFGAWVMNIGTKDNQAHPNITFRIEKTDGTLLQSFTTGDIPSQDHAQWIQYAFYFKTPPGISNVRLRMTNNANGGYGNDIALDDITFRAAGPVIQTGVSGMMKESVTICESDKNPLPISAKVENCFTKAIYQWQKSTDGGRNWTDIPGAAAQTYNRPATSTGSYFYRMTVAETGNEGIASCTIASSPVSVEVVNSVAAVSISTSSVAVCTGRPVTFTATPTNGGGSPSYQWQVNGVNVGTGGNIFTTSSLTGSDEVSCLMTSAATCVAHPVVTSNKLAPPLALTPSTGVGITASATGVCQDSTVRFTAQPINGGDKPSYAWKVNGVVTESSGAVYTTKAIKDGDLIDVTMLSSVACSQPVTAPEPVKMTVFPAPQITLTADTSIERGGSVQLNPVVNGTISSYQWSPAEGLDNPAIADPVASPGSTISYRLDVLSTDGCGASANEQVVVVNGTMLPNAFSPNGDGHNDLFRLPPSSPLHLRRMAVFNRYGEMIFYTTNAGEGWDGGWKGQAQPAGVYIWEIEYESQVTQKVETRKGTVVLVR